MVSLTSLLVLTGLLTQTSQTIPKTAYLKLIDVWYIVLICVDFLIIVVLVVIEGLRQQARPSAAAVKKVKIHSDDTGHSPHHQEHITSVENREVQGIDVSSPQFRGRIKQDGVTKAAQLNRVSMITFPLFSVTFFLYFFVKALNDVAIAK